MKDEAVNRPVVVFISDDNASIGDRLKQAIRQETRVLFNHIQAEEEAAQQK